MNNTDLQKIAEKIINQVPNKKDEEKFGSVLLILTIISVILTLIRVIQECKKSKIRTFGRAEKYVYFGEQTKEISIRRSWFTKMTIKKILRKELDREQYLNYGGALVEAILNTGENLTKDEIKTLVEAANV